MWRMQIEVGWQSLTRLDGDNLKAVLHYSTRAGKGISERKGISGVSVK